jgi:hypothetical protein
MWLAEATQTLLIFPLPGTAGWRAKKLQENGK